MGWGIVEVSGTKCSYIACGVCNTKKEELAQRLLSLHDQLTDIFHKYEPNAAAIEKTFVNKDGAGTLKLGQARAIGLLVPAQFGMIVGEYAPNTVKKVVVGVGHADKKQVDHMVRLQLPTAKITGPDAADALAIALCHMHHVQFSGRLDAAIAKAGNVA